MREHGRRIEVAQPIFLHHTTAPRKVRGYRPSARTSENPLGPTFGERSFYEVE
jgi:hypothetical protein